MTWLRAKMKDKPVMLTCMFLIASKFLTFLALYDAKSVKIPV